MRAAILFLACAPLALPQKQPVTLESMEEAARLAPQGPGNPVAWSPDGTKFLYRQARKLMLYDPAAQTSRELVDGAAMDAAAVNPPAGLSQPFEWENRRVREAPVQWGASGRILFLAGGDIFVVDAGTGKWTQLTKTPVAERDPKLSPDGKSIAFRRGWDLYALDVATRHETRLTTGGSDTLRNGGLDWVYPEELDLGTAYWWSPDSKSIAYLQFDLSREPVYPHEDLRGPHAIYEPQHYPQAGENNPDVKIGVVAASGGGTRWLDPGKSNENLIARAGWTPDSRSVYVLRANRIQNHAELLSLDAASGKASRIFEESDRYWINLPDDPVFVNGGKQLLITSERDGFRHIYLYSSDGKQVRQLTRGAWEVTGIAGVDETEGRVYFTSSEISPLERQLYSVGINGEGKRRLSAGSGTHTIAMGPGAHFYLDTVSSVESPPRTTLHAGDGKELGVYREKDTRVTEQFQILPTELVSFKGGDGTLFYARLIRPAGFDASKKYPAVVLVYGGPGAQGVHNAWSGMDLDQVLAQRGFVVWQVDNRGSTGRGHAFETPIFRKLGAVELADQVA
ncbi:MAG TPA: DPP IV N-terminal domain-containing protein, partial [Bryobacteraceae bacterium]